jgi:hypothetical protein
MNNIEDELRSLGEETDDSERIVYCSPGDERACKAIVEHIPQLILQVHPWMESGIIYIVDPRVAVDINF